VSFKFVLEDLKRCAARAVIVRKAGQSLRGSSRASEIKRLRRGKICQEKTRTLFGGHFCISGVTTDGLALAD
jgi:hypothetical protein